MRIYGYARVSTKEQKLDRQKVELEKYVEERFIFEDKQSGKDFDRPQYQLLRKVAQKGDVIYIKSLDRLGRNKEQIKKELEHYKNEGVRVKIIDLPTTMKDFSEGQDLGQDLIMEMINNLLIEVLSTIAEQERVTIRKRQQEGIQALKNRNDGKGIGRPKAEVPEGFEAVYKDWKQGNITGVKAMEKLGMKRTTFYRYVKLYEEGEQR